MARRGLFSRTTGTIAAGLLVAALAVIAAGCGSSSKASVASTPTTTAAGGGAAGFTRSAAFQAFQTCLKQHGITTGGFFGGRPGGSGGTETRPTPPTGTNGGAGSGGGFGGFRRNLTPAEQKAFTACRAKLPAGGFGGGFRRGGTGSPAFAKYTACLKQHGVTLGAPATNATVFAKASAACAKLRPTFGGGQRPTTTTTTAGG